MRTVRAGQLYRDLARDMLHRNRRLRVVSVDEDDRASCFVEHDRGGPAGRTPRIALTALASPAKWELLEEAPAVDTDPLYDMLLAALTGVHRSAATPADYANAAWTALADRIRSTPGSPGA
ncbi:DUF6354 family protein [Streptomyces sp. NPDC051546]|uniref:DUF6354 family protein n=1 Tax=Streptomyces sp. NPDC051546 TaxID=3365655 RepID=UPI003795E33A